MWDIFKIQINSRNSSTNFSKKHFVKPEIQAFNSKRNKCHFFKIWFFRRRIKLLIYCVPRNFLYQKYTTPSRRESHQSKFLSFLAGFSKHQQDKIYWKIILQKASWESWKYNFIKKQREVNTQLLICKNNFTMLITFRIRNRKYLRLKTWNQRVLTKTS